jgi:hypothetical protein
MEPLHGDSKQGKFRQMIHDSGKLAESYIQGDLISESSVFRQSIRSSDFTTSTPYITRPSSDIVRYKGSKSPPEWMDIEPGGHPTLTA